MDLRTTKNGKFYVVCDPCGLQAFVRRKEGMERLQKLRQRLQKMDAALEGHAESLFAIQGILREISALKHEIEILNEKAGFFFPDAELIRARDALQVRLDELLKTLEQEARH